MALDPHFSSLCLASSQVQAENEGGAGRGAGDEPDLRVPDAVEVRPRQEVRSRKLEGRRGDGAGKRRKDASTKIFQSYVQFIQCKFTY